MDSEPVVARDRQEIRLPPARRSENAGANRSGQQARRDVTAVERDRDERECRGERPERRGGVEQRLLGPAAVLGKVSPEIGDEGQ